MNAPLIPREQAFANARRVLDAARARRDRDRAAGLLDPAAETACRRLEQQPATAHRAAA